MQTPIVNCRFIDHNNRLHIVIDLSPKSRRWPNILMPWKRNVSARYLKIDLIDILL